MKRTEIDYTIKSYLITGAIITISDIRNAATKEEVKTEIGDGGWEEYRFTEGQPSYRMVLKMIHINTDGSRGRSAIKFEIGDTMDSDHFGNAVKIMKAAGKRLGEIKSRQVEVKTVII